MSERVVCPACKGHGDVRERIEWLPAILTFGMSVLIQLSEPARCKVCGGNGYLLCERSP